MTPGRVLVAGGGTGGHVFPSLAVAAALARARPGLDVEFVGTARGLESTLVPAAGWPLHTVSTPPLARRLSPQTLRLPAAVLRATRAVHRLVRARDVRAALVFGGYVAVPLVLASRWAGIPLVVHEQNAVPGVTNRLAARWARSVAVTFPGSDRGFRRPVVVTGNPVRPELATAPPRAEGLDAFALSARRRTLLVFGGSQGAQRINEALVAATGCWRAPGELQILHAPGRRGAEAARRAWAAAGVDDAGEHPSGLLVRCVPFIERMELAYAAADVVVSRAGASTIAELTVLGLPAVLVPYPHATADHQRANAEAVAAAGAGLVVRDEALDAEALVAAVDPLVEDDARRRAMAAAARSLGRPDAAVRVAELVLAALDDALAERRDASGGGRGDVDERSRS